MVLNRSLDLKVFWLIIFGLAVDNALGFDEDMDPESATANSVQVNLFGKQRIPSKDLLYSLRTVLVKTAVMYIALMIFTYYLILQAYEDAFFRLLSIFGKIIFSVSVAIYIIGEFILPLEDTYMMLSRMAVFIFVLSVLQMLHWAICLFGNIIAWSFVLMAFLELIRRGDDSGLAIIHLTM